MLGPPGSGKSDLLLRLLAHGYKLVGDDQLLVRDGYVAAPPELAGLLEVRGLGIMRLPYQCRVRPVLAVALEQGERLPHPARHPVLDIPLIRIDPAGASAPQRISLALDCLAGRVGQVAGAFV